MLRIQTFPPDSSLLTCKSDRMRSVANGPEIICYGKAFPGTSLLWPGMRPNLQLAIPSTD